MGNYVKLNVSKSTKKLVTEACVKEFLKEHPDHKGRHITQEHIVRQMAEYYLK